MHLRLRAFPGRSRLARCGGFQSLDFAFGRGVGDISADDLVFIDQKRRVDRLRGTGVVGDFIDVAHYVFACELGQVVALTFLQIVVAAENLGAFLGNLYTTALHRGSGCLPAKLL